MLKMIMRFGLFAGALSLGACALGPAEPSADAPATLENLVIDDPSFDFSTSRAVTLDLQPDDAAAQPKRVEVRDSEGRRLMAGGFAVPTSLELKLPLGAEPTLTVRTGRDADLTERSVTLDDQGRGSANF